MGTGFVLAITLFTSINTTKALFKPSVSFSSDRDDINWNTTKAGNLKALMQISTESTEAIKNIQQKLTQQKTHQQEAVSNINKIIQELRVQEVTTMATIAQWPILISTFPTDTPALSNLKSLLVQDIQNIKMDLEKIRQSLILFMKKQQEALIILNK